ncbi:MAG: type IV secretion system DNA-binding domain-containing protein, partial [Planctomycetes bacterium]|nr:type IV secretion system DNA-binding domain-containing protein [Planctomycetota bacterium]
MTQRIFKNLTGLLAQSAAGMMISGSSGTGKSCVMRLLMRILATSGEGFFLLDPHGDLARDVESDCSSLPEHVRRRIVIIRPSDTNKGSGGLNPLHVSKEGISHLTWLARISVKAFHTAMILLHAWGERDFNSKPVMAKWTKRFLTMLARACLSLADVRHFFDVKSPVYQALTKIAPDFVSRMELEQLADMRPKDREELIASTKNRFLGFLENPIVEMTLGQTENVYDVSKLIENRAIVIISLEPASVLSDSDVEIFANLWLSEIFFAVYNTPANKRVPCHVFLDELPVFLSSAPLITRALAQIRKMKLRLIVAFQGTQVFDRTTESPLLNAIIGQCRTHIVFRHSNPVDAKYFAEVVKLGSLDVFKRKHTVRQTQQIQIGHDVVTLFDEAENWSDAEQQGGSEADGTTETTTNTDSSSTARTDTTTTHPHENALRDAVSLARADVAGSSTAQAAGTTRTSTASWSTTRSHGGSRTRKQVLVPRFRNEILEHIQFLSPDEQLTIVASKIASFDTGIAILHIAGKGAGIVKFPLPLHPFRHTPKYGRKKLQELRQLVFSRSQYVTTEKLIEMREAFVERLVAHLNAIATEHDSKRLGYSSESLPNKSES